MDDAYARDVSEVRPAQPPPVLQPESSSGKPSTALVIRLALPCSQVLAHYQVDLDHGMTLDQVEKVRRACVGCMRSDAGKGLWKIARPLGSGLSRPDC